MHRTELKGIESKVETGKEAEVTMSNSKVEIGGTLVNKGKMKVYSADVAVGGDMIQEGEFIVNDPEKIKEILLEIARTTHDVTEIGKLVVERIIG